MVRGMRWWATAAVLGGALLGCTHTTVQQKGPPPDPLLVTRKPLEGKPRPEELSVRLQPPAPPSSGDLTTDPDAGQVRPVQLRLQAPRAGGE